MSYINPRINAKFHSLDLSKNHKPTQVVLCTAAGLQSGSSYQYRCRTCKYVYSYDSFSLGLHKFYYKEKRQFIKATRILFVDRALMDYWQQLSIHSQVSFEALAISYSMSYKETSPLVTKVFNVYNADDDDDDDDIEEGAHSLRTQLNRKQVAEAFWEYLIEKVTRDLELLDEPLVGSKKESQEAFMDKVEEHRKTGLLPHICMEACEDRACSKSTSMDGIWKTRYWTILYNIFFYKLCSLNLMLFRLF